MPGLVLAILFGLNCLLFPCEGQISLPPRGDTFVFLPGKNVTIAWKLDVSISDLTLRSWTFQSGQSFAEIFRDGDVQENPQHSPGSFTVEKNATLILKNVTIQYNGTYRFSILTTNNMLHGSDVYVFVAVKPNVTFSCSNPYTINEGDNSTCVCRGESGNPPADVTWYKDGFQIGGTGKEELTLTLSNVSGTNRGSYTCRAQSYTLADNKSIEVKIRLNFKPKNTNITFTPERAVVGESVIITCNSDGLPEPSYSIIHNGTEVSTNKKYTIDDVQHRHDGIYKCVAMNKRGKDSASGNLTVIEKPNATINCSSPIIVNEDDDLICVCTDGGGNPPANLTWYKDDKQIGNSSYGENSLTLTSVTKDVIGTYECVARRYTLTNETSIEVKVRLNLEPYNTKITITPQETEVGTSVNIMCYSEGRPEPRYNIIYNDTVLSTGKPYTISKAKLSDAGIYECIAWNNLGRDSASAGLTVEVKPYNTRFTIEPEYVRLWGGPVAITCDSEGIPEPTYTIKQDDTKQGKKYTISTVGLSDGGTYECIATNKLGSDSASGDLDVAKWPLVLLVIGVVLLVVVIIAIVIYCYLKKKKRDGYKSSCFRGNADVSPGASAGIPVNHYELDEGPAGGVDNAYDTVNNTGATGSKSKPPENTTPDVYAAVDKKSREGKPLYATLDSLALQADNSKKKRDEERAGQTEYASIDFAKIGKADQE